MAERVGYHERYMRKRVVVLGSTGSIGTQTLDALSQLPDEFEIVGLAAGRNAAILQEQAARFGVKRIALFEGDTPGIPTGIDAISELAVLPEADLVVVSVAGVIGLKPTVAAIQAGKGIALASKEVLVAAGHLVMPMVREYRTRLTPIDSEHSAIFQCLQGIRPDQVDRLILTASGGPFRGRSRADLAAVTIQQALNHPTWRMGGKITIDSATLMNKGLELIEARWLFDVPMERIDVVVHPQSVVHSFVQTTDGSVIGQLGWPDMRLPILYALCYPERPANRLPAWNPVATPNLTFEAVDAATFPSLDLAREADRMGGSAPCVLNAANEEAVARFLREEIGFLDIYRSVEAALERPMGSADDIESLVAVDAETRRFVRTLESRVVA